MSERETYEVPAGTVVEDMKKVVSREVVGERELRELKKAAKKRGDKELAKDARTG